MSECPYCQNTFEMQDTCSDEFRMWQGLQGPYYIPTVDEEGVLSWTNTGGLPNPDPVDISGPAGASFSIAGIVETVADLPQSAEGVWLVGEFAPYDGYSYIIDSWEFIGQFAIGPEGPQGEPGAAGASAGFGTPTATVDSSAGTPSVTVTASGPDTAKVFAFAFHNLKGDKGEDGQPGAAGQGVPTGGTAGQVLAKRSGTNYDTEWVNQSGGADPATVAPLMDGTAAVGTSTKYAREDHVHPTDTSRQETLVSGTNIKTINNNSLLGSGDITIGGAVDSVNGKTGTVVLDADDVGAMSKWDLLWENASPASGFAAQTVLLDLSGYDFVLIYSFWSTNYLQFIAPHIALINPTGSTIESVLQAVQTNSAASLERVFVVTSSGVEFKKATLGSSQDNNKLIPVRIYGIKGVVTT